jgi:hypothetical protein
MAERTFHIEDGVNVDASWLNHLAISRDGVNWDPIHKDSIDVNSRIVNKQSSANGGNPADPKGPRAIISLERGGDDNPIVQFDISNVANQPTWSTGSINTDLQTAVSDITGWLSSQVATVIAGGTATEATLLSILAELKLDFDFEIKCVRDTVTDAIYIMRVQKDETDGSITIDYIDATGSVIVPPTPGNLVVCDANVALSLIKGVLDNILLDTTSINNAIHLEVDDDAIAVEQELPTNINLLYGAFEGEGVEWERIQTDGNGYLKGISDVLIELGLIKNNTNDVATQTTLAALKANQDAVDGTDGVAHGAAQQGVRALGTDGTNDQQLLTDATGALQVDILSGGGSITEGTDGAAHGASQLGIRALGTDGTNDQQISTDADGHIQVDILSGGGTPGAALEVTLLALSAKLNSLGQKASAASAPVVLSTEQEAILAGIDTVLDNIKLDTAALVVDAAAIEVLITQIDVVLDTIKVDTGLMVTDLAAIEVLLTTIDTVLDTIKTDTAAMVVDLAAIEVNTNIQSLTLTSSSTTGAGAIPAGAYAATIFIDGIGGVVNGVVRPNGWSQTFEFYNYTLPVGTIPYDGMGATVYVDIFS